MFVCLSLSLPEVDGPRRYFYLQIIDREIPQQTEKEKRLIEIKIPMFKAKRRKNRPHANNISKTFHIPVRNLIHEFNWKKRD